MIRYRNIGGDSNVAAYMPGVDSIKVQFGDGSIYLYTHSSAGKWNVDQMKTLAEGGQGLNGFINTHVKKKYERKLR